ncbi:uncharacterized protein [Rutidosis leptorrhynchoides]|uniref:uncharacterized protein n=1 Tax=Rutidosis leptorrhynchoides TaxID=125765 RepID=UPI003A9924EF
MLSRDLLGLDGAFMNELATGQILGVVGVDSNNGIYSLAYAMKEAENYNYWSWFLECLRDDLNLTRMPNFTFIMGTFKCHGKDNPMYRNKFCLRHLHENMKSKWRGLAYKQHLLKCATATTVPHFEKFMMDLKGFDEAAWKWIVDGRDKPIITCLVFIREYLMKRLYGVKNKIMNSQRLLTPKETKVFEEIKKEANKKWELTGMPCKHVIPCIWNMRANDPKVPRQEHKSIVRILILPPLQIATTGRLEKNRTKGLHDNDDIVFGGKYSKKGQVIQCGICKGFGHNRRSCTNGGVKLDQASRSKRKSMAKY